MQGKVCILQNDTQDCPGIPATNSSEWWDYLNSEMRFLIITYTGPITDQALEKGLAHKAFVLGMDSDDFREKLVPYADTATNFTLNCTRIRNCDVIRQPFYLYPFAIALYAIIAVVWIWSLRRSPGDMLAAQKILSTFFIMKGFCDVAMLYYMARCRPTGYMEGVDQIMHDVGHLVRPIFEGLITYFLLSMTLVSVCFSAGRLEKMGPIGEMDLSGRADKM